MAFFAVPSPSSEEEPSPKTKTSSRWVGALLSTTFGFGPGVVVTRGFLVGRGASFTSSSSSTSALRLLGAFVGAFGEALVDAFAAALVGAFFVEAGALATAGAFPVAFSLPLGLDAVVFLGFGELLFMPVGWPFGGASLDAVFLAGGFVDAFSAALTGGLAGIFVVACLRVVADFVAAAVLAMVLVSPLPSAKGFILVVCFADSIVTLGGSGSVVAYLATWNSVTSRELIWSRVE